MDHSCHRLRLQHPSLCAHRGSPAQQHSSACAQQVCKEACNTPGTQKSISQEQDAASFFLHISPHYLVLIWLSWYLRYSIGAKCKPRPLISATAAHCWENNIDVTSSITHFLFHLYANADLSPKLSQRSISLKRQIAHCRQLLWLSLSFIIIISFNLTSTVKHNC